MKQKWKKAFIVLLTINFALLVLLFVLISAPVDDTRITPSSWNEKDAVSFHVASNKRDLNLLINHYLEKEAADSPVDYKVLLKNEVELYGSMPLFSEELDMKLTFEPEALDNGDMILRQKSISLGKLQLPVSYVLKFISERYKLPKGVSIQPKKEMVYIQMNELKLKSDTKIRVDEFNLKEDNISFTLLVPVK